MLQDSETTPSHRKQLSKSQKRRRRRKKLRKIRSAEPAIGHSSDSSSTKSSSGESESMREEQQEKIFLPRGNISSTLRRLEKERLWASQDRQWNQSYLLQGSKPVSIGDNEDNNM